MTITGGLGLQSFCLRGYKTTPEVIAKLKDCGLSSIELWSGHADFSDASGYDSIVEQYEQAGVKIASTGANSFANNEAKERGYFEFAKRAGSKHMTVNFDMNTMPECFRTAEKLAEEYDMTLGIHNHGGHHWLGSVQALSYVLANTGERVGLTLDTAWAIDAAEDPVKMARKFADRLYGVHLKDFVYSRERKHEDVIVGSGIFDLRGFSDVLEDAGFDGVVVIEYEGDVDNPVPALKQCVAEIRKTAIQ